MFKIRIHKTHTEHIHCAILSRRIVFLFIFEVWVTEDYKEGNADRIWEYVCGWVDEFNITVENITDLTQEADV